jgi:hypothetical protein
VIQREHREPVAIRKRESILIKFLPLFVLAAAFIVLFTVLARRKPGNTAYKSAVGLALAAAFFLFWVNSAVGIIGDESNDANLMYLGVLAVGGIGAIVARFQPHGMARALFATALAQALVAVIALIAGLGSTGPIWPWDVLILTGFFGASWLGSALLFRTAAREQPPAGAGPED